MLIALTEKVQSCHALLWSLGRKEGRKEWGFTLLSTA